MSKHYPVEQRERAVKMVLDHLGEYRSVYAAAQALGPKVGVGPETRRKEVRSCGVLKGGKDRKVEPRDVHAKRAIHGRLTVQVQHVDAVAAHERRQPCQIVFGLFMATARHVYRRNIVIPNRNTKNFIYARQELATVACGSGNTAAGRLAMSTRSGPSVGACGCRPRVAAFTHCGYPRKRMVCGSVTTTAMHPYRRKIVRPAIKASPRFKACGDRRRLCRYGSAAATSTIARAKGSPVFTA
jgi:hypothetical protein